MPTKTTSAKPKSATTKAATADKRAAKAPAKRKSNAGRKKKPADEKYKSLHVMLPPVVFERIKSEAARGFKSQGQVVVDAVIAQYGLPEAEG